MKRGNVVPAALVLSAVLACSEPPAGSLPPPTSPTPSVTATATPTPNAGDASALRAALHAYFDALYAAGLDPAGKTDELEALIDPSCPCRQVIDVLREQASDGRYVDYRYTLRDVTVVDVDARAGHVRYTVRQSPGALRDRTGRAVKSYPASSDRYSAVFVRASDGWLLKRLESYA